MEETMAEGVEVREELMISPSGGDSTRRQAHFLKPTAASTEERVFDLPSLSLSSIPPTFDLKKGSLNIDFRGWRSLQKDWKQWVGKMAALHGSEWEKVGIRQAILNSTYEIRRNNDLVLGLAEKWCVETNTFIFPWGEATITLEDLVVFGYSVLGSPVSEKTEELKGIVEKLEAARLELNKSSAKKADQHRWMQNFMDSGNEIEHEAFLALWLSRFVFPISKSVIVKSVFHIAVELARGTRVALAPAILAGIYRDLSKLKENFVALTKLEDSKSINLVVMITSPFLLVQIWAWERFLEFRPEQNAISSGEPRLALWHKKKVGVKNVRVALDSAKEQFVWRPYARTIENWSMPKFYVEKETLLLVGPDLSEELESFARCLRISKLVGLDCIEDYFPNRVAMQFGFDQDLPALGAALENETPEMAWINYSKPISSTQLYIPSRFFEADVTTRYLEWWKQRVSCLRHASEDEEHLLLDRNSNLSGKNLKRSRGEEGSSTKKTLMREKRRVGDGGSTSFKLPPRRCDVDSSSRKESRNAAEECRVEKESSEEVSLSIGFGSSPLNIAALMADNSSVPPGFPPKSKTKVGKDSTEEDRLVGVHPESNLMGNDSMEEDSLTIAELLRSAKRHGDSIDAELPSLTANIKDSRIIEVQAALVEETEHNEVGTGRSEAATEVVNMTEAGLPIDDVVNVQGNYKKGDADEDAVGVVMGSQLEDRDSRIERFITETKAKSSSHPSAS